ncbi:hypothetical protein AZE42_13875 [Rhizopogon vesiculosus]|uniref:Uncharacterized protein n=1 Tax=Rhizopogon vesiculosus TaxID=180088 RepID=A0A1J8Q222_9AGAM|nr:hypothetical protein AZE42_13875 [Rhizopogon vesiculosus]
MAHTKNTETLLVTVVQALKNLNQPEVLLQPLSHLDYLARTYPGTRKKIQSRSLKVTTALWPAILCRGDTPGEDFDPEDIIDELFREYLVTIFVHSFR